MFRSYYPRLCAFAAEYTSPERARDIVQEVFLKIWERRADWHLHTSLKSYLYQAVRNQSLNSLRREKTHRHATDYLKRSQPRVRRQTAEDVYHVKALSQAVERAIDQLPERRRMVFVLHRKHGCTYAEIARIMDITPKTVENQIGRALKTLRKLVLNQYLAHRR